MSTGFNPRRGDDHEDAVKLMVNGLEQRGYRPETLGVNGDDPDVRIHDLNGHAAYVDVKTTLPNQRNWAVKHGSLAAYWRLTLSGTPVYVIWVRDEPLVDSVFTLTRRIVGGPRRPTGRGSLTDWVLVEPGGTMFDAFFPSIAKADAA